MSFRSFKTARHHHHHRGDDAFARGGGGGGGGGGSSFVYARRRQELVPRPRTPAKRCGFRGTRSSIQHHRHHHEKDKTGKIVEEEFVKIDHFRDDRRGPKEGSRRGRRKVRVKNLKVHRDGSTRAMALQALRNEAGCMGAVPSNIYASQDSGRSSFAQAASPAKCVVTSRLRESFTLHMDDNGNVLAVDTVGCPVGAFRRGRRRRTQQRKRRRVRRYSSRTARSFDRWPRRGFRAGAAVERGCGDDGRENAGGPMGAKKARD